mgnify:CR=1 FL=1
MLHHKQKSESTQVKDMKYFNNDWSCLLDRHKGTTPYFLGLDCEKIYRLIPFLRCTLDDIRFVFENSHIKLTMSEYSAFRRIIYAI